MNTFSFIMGLIAGSGAATVFWLYLFHKNPIVGADDVQ
jgi:hypothetical protein